MKWRSEDRGRGAAISYLMDEVGARRWAALHVCQNDRVGEHEDDRVRGKIC